MLMVAAILGVVFSGTASAHKGGDEALYDPDSGAALEVKVRQMFADMDAGNTESMMKWADDDVVIYDTNETGAPVGVYNHVDAQKMFDGYAKMMKTEGSNVKSTINKIDCHATTSMGFCVLEFDQNQTVSGKTMPAMKFRATMIARNKDGSWRWTHWHASPREAGTMMVEPAMRQ